MGDLLYTNYFLPDTDKVLWMQETYKHRNMYFTISSVHVNTSTMMVLQAQVIKENVGLSSKTIGGPYFEYL